MYLATRFETSRVVAEMGLWEEINEKSFHKVKHSSSKAVVVAACMTVSHQPRDMCSQKPNTYTYSIQHIYIYLILPCNIVRSTSLRRHSSSPPPSSFHPTNTIN